MLIETKSGRIELDISLPLPEEPPRETNKKVKSVVLCHPHPQFGGSMNNKVVHTLAKTTVSAGHRAIRFNFRGVGASEGQFDHGVGEREDLASVVRAILEQFPTEPLLLAGFSFGAYVAAEFCTQESNHCRVDALCLVAPPIGRMSFSSSASLELPLTVIAAEDDELIPTDRIRHWSTEAADIQRFTVIQGASHFFHGKLRQLSDAFFPFISD
ncbi:MAG TPA: alpha/beta hydrolase [Gammaproteobacteria bacterium]|nr:alpha/beta hydrolase [Gammaproteobacteria bacterium]